jgi:hypothetical protein
MDEPAQERLRMLIDRQQLLPVGELDRT